MHVADEARAKPIRLGLLERSIVQSSRKGWSQLGPEVRIALASKPGVLPPPAWFRGYT